MEQDRTGNASSPGQDRKQGKSRVPVKNVIGGILLAAVAVLIAGLGYQVIAKAGELPGRLGSVPAAAGSLNVMYSVANEHQKISYESMKYGFMEDQLIAQMDLLDREAESRELEAIRSVNNLTAMFSRTSDKIAYDKVKAEREAEEKKRKDADLAAKLAQQARERAAEMRQRQSRYARLTIDTGSGDTASKGGRIGEPIFVSQKGKSLGKFVITAYCTCRICCGVYSGGNRTASGTVPTSNRTIAVDTDVIPFGTRVIINGQVYVAEDRGGAIKGKRIDMFFMTHKEALKWGRQTVEVFLAD